MTNRYLLGGAQTPTVSGSLAATEVPTIAALKALAEPTDQFLIITLGHTAAGDGGLESWYWDASSSATDDSSNGIGLVTVVRPTGSSGNGRWLRARGSSVGLTQLATQSPYTLVANDTASSAVPTARSIADFGAIRTFTTIALLKAGTARYANERVSVLGYYTAGDGGGGEFYWDSASSTADNGGTVFAPDAGGAGRWMAVGDMSNPARWGAKGDNSTNDYAAIYAMRAAGAVIKGDLSKTYKVNSALAFTGYDNLTIKDLNLNMVAVANGADLLTVAGSASATSTTLSVAGAKNATSLTVVSSTSFAAGDMVQISSTEDFSGTDANYVKGELGFVASIGGATNITLTSGLKDAYSITGETVTITKLNKIINPVIENVTITGNGAGATHVGIRVTYAVNPVVRGVKISGCETTGVDFAQVDNGLIEGGNVTGANSTATGYAYSFSNFTQNSRLTKSRAYNFRHAFTTGSYNPVWGWSVTDNDFSHSIGAANSGAGILTHNNGIHGTVADNRIDDVAYGVYLSGPHTTVKGNRVWNCYASCYSAGPDGTRDTLFTGNYGHGVRGIEGGTFSGSVGSAKLVIRGNEFVGEDVNGVTRDYGLNVTTDNAIIEGNKVDGFVTAAYTPSGSNIQILRNDFRNYTTLHNDSGTGTAFRGNWMSGVQQSYGVMGVAGFGVYGGAPNVDGKAGIATTGRYLLNGKIILQNLVDDKFDLTAVTTGAAEYKKVLLCLDDGYVGRIVQGTAAADQESALVPPHPWNYTPIAIVEIPNSYAGGTLGAAVFHQLIGIQGDK